MDIIKTSDLLQGIVKIAWTDTQIDILYKKRLFDSPLILAQIAPDEIDVRRESHIVYKECDSLITRCGDCKADVIHFFDEHHIFNCNKQVVDTLFLQHYHVRCEDCQKNYEENEQIEQGAENAENAEHLWRAGLLRTLRERRENSGGDK